MQKKIKNRVGKRAERKLKREEGTIDEAVRSVNQRHNIVEGKSPYSKRERSVDHTRLDEDWEGNNIAVTCPACGKVYIVSGRIHQGKRDCPKCGKSTGKIEGGRKSNGTATLKW